MKTCGVCGRPILEGEDYLEDIFGGASHAECLEVVEDDEDDDGRD